MNIAEILALFGGSTVIATGIAIFFSRLLLNKLTGKWNKKSQIEIEKVKNELDKEQNKINNLITSYSQFQSQTHGERVIAVKELWKNVLKIRKINEHAVFFYSLLMPNEYNKFATEKDYEEFILKVNNLPETFRSISEISDNVEKYRPFLSEYLWGLFSIYLSFSGRLAYQLYNGFKDGNIKTWNKDKGINQFINIILNKKELELLNYNNPIFIKNIVWKIEEKIVIECSKIISGDFAIDKSLEVTDKIHKAIVENSIKRK